MGQTASYMKAYRDANPGLRERERAAQKARSKALHRLAACHPGEFAMLLDEERSKAELPAIGEVRQGRKRREMDCTA